MLWFTGFHCLGVNGHVRLGQTAVCALCPTMTTCNGEDGTHLSLTKEYMSSRSSMKRFQAGLSPWRSRYMSLDTMMPSNSYASLTMKQSSLHTTLLPATRRDGVKTRIFFFSRSLRMCWSESHVQRDLCHMWRWKTKSLTHTTFSFWDLSFISRTAFFRKALLHFCIRQI